MKLITYNKQSNKEYSNFSFLASYQYQGKSLAEYGWEVEKYFPDDANTTGHKARVLLESLCFSLLEKFHLRTDYERYKNNRSPKSTDLSTLINFLEKHQHKIGFSNSFITLCHAVRSQGNRASHTEGISLQQAEQCLRDIYSVAVEFYQVVSGNMAYKEQPFRLPEKILLTKQADITHWQQQVTEKDKQIEQTNKELHLKESEITNLNHEVQSLKNQLNSTQVNSEEKIRLQNDLDQANEKLNKLNQQFEDIEEQLAKERDEKENFELNVLYLQETLQTVQDKLRQKESAEAQEELRLKQAKRQEAESLANKAKAEARAAKEQEKAAKALAKKQEEERKAAELNTLAQKDQAEKEKLAHEAEKQRFEREKITHEKELIYKQSAEHQRKKAEAEAIAAKRLEEEATARANQAKSEAQAAKIEEKRAKEALKKAETERSTAEINEHLAREKLAMESATRKAAEERVAAQQAKRKHEELQRDIALNKHKQSLAERIASEHAEQAAREKRIAAESHAKTAYLLQKSKQQEYLKQITSNLDKEQKLKSQIINFINEGEQRYKVAKTDSERAFILQHIQNAQMRLKISDKNIEVFSTLLDDFKNREERLIQEEKLRLQKAELDKQAAQEAKLKEEAQKLIQEEQFKKERLKAKIQAERYQLEVLKRRGWTAFFAILIITTLVTVLWSNKPKPTITQTSQEQSKPQTVHKTLKPQTSENHDDTVFNKSEGNIQSDTTLTSDGFIISNKTKAKNISAIEMRIEQSLTHYSDDIIRYYIKPKTWKQNLLKKCQSNNEDADKTIACVENGLNLFAEHLDDYQQQIQQNAEIYQDLLNTMNQHVEILLKNARKNKVQITKQQQWAKWRDKQCSDKLANELLKCKIKLTQEHLKTL